MDGRRPRGMMFAPSGAGLAWPVGGANMSEPQDAASESMGLRPDSPREMHSGSAGRSRLVTERHDWRHFGRTAWYFDRGRAATAELRSKVGRKPALSVEA